MCFPISQKKCRARDIPLASVCRSRPGVLSLLCRRHAIIEEDARVAIALRQSNHLHLLLPGSEVFSLLQRAAARQRALVCLRCRHFLTEAAPTKRGNSKYIERSLLVLFEEAGSRQLPCGEPISSQPNRNFFRRPRCCGVFKHRFCFAFSRDLRATQATLPYAGSSASPNLRAQQFRVPRCSSEQIKIAQVAIAG